MLCNMWCYTLQSMAHTSHKFPTWNVRTYMESTVALVLVLGGRLLTVQQITNGYNYYSGTS